LDFLGVVRFVQSILGLLAAGVNERVRHMMQLLKVVKGECLLAPSLWLFSSGTLGSLSLLG
jgi:hypothetical protein